MANASRSVAGADEKLGVGPHEGHGHGDLGTVGRTMSGAVPDFLMRLRCSPAAGVEAR